MTLATRIAALSFFLRQITLIGLPLLCSVTAAASTEYGTSVVSDARTNSTNPTPEDVRLFDLHDPGLTGIWSTFLATTPMLNEQLLPATLQHRLATVVGTYRSLTPVDQPAFFVATYFDLLAKQLMVDGAQAEREILPLQVCPVFESGSAAPVSKLLALASGLSNELFLNAPGQPDRYRYFLLHTEFSHCRFLTSVSRAEDDDALLSASDYSDPVAARILFRVGNRKFSALVSSNDELRAIVETVGEVDAMTSFRKQWPASDFADEADVLQFVRLLSLLASDSKNGYGAIPVLFPLLSASGVHSDQPVSLTVADAMEIAYGLRATFRRLVPFAIRDADDLRNARMSLEQALAATDTQLDTTMAGLLQQFVAGSDLLLPLNAAAQ